jgi:outer membrane murein-binding lipoprotein Lpp
MKPSTKNILKGIFVPLLVIAACAILVQFLSGCSSLREIWSSDETQAAIASNVQRLAGTDKLAEKFDAAAEQQQLSYAFTWLTAQKAGISETDARDWLARQNAGSEDAAPPEEEAADVDAVDFSLLKWEFGGVDGSKARLDSPRLSSLRASSSSISYKWEKGLDGWGLAKDQADAYACLFVAKSDGSVVGGKFDWVSTSRANRGLENILEGYRGWSLEGVPNPTIVYFLVTDTAGKRRSNIVSAEWSR